jgi:uncharacterized protein
VILYLDTSALVKIYVEETRSTDVRENAKRAEGLATSRIAYAEAQAAFARKRREKGLSGADYCSVVTDLDQDRDDYFIFDLSETVVRAAGFGRESCFERRRRHSSCLSGDFEQTGERKHNVSLF